MNRFVKFLFILLVPFLFTNCPTHPSNPDKVTKNSLILYSFNCHGGSLTACNGGCNSQCGIADGAAVTTDKFSCLTNCQSTCSSDCNVSTTLLLYLSNHPIKK